MDIVIFFFFTITVVFILASASEAKDQEKKPEEQEKKCPPHKWDYGQDGKISCKFCGPMSNLNHKARGDE